MQSLQVLLADADTDAIVERAGLFSADQAWKIVAASLVLLMTPALAFFYGGMTRAKATLNMMMMSFVSVGIVGCIWVLWGYPMAFGGKDIGGLFANPFEHFGMYGMLGDKLDADTIIDVGFQATFAIITVALISGAIADRARFGTWSIFVPVWLTIVYIPIAHWVWGDGGLLTSDGAIGKHLVETLDYAGGTVVHINAGVAALVLALIIGKRQGFGTDPRQRPHNIPFVMLGAAFLWFGWFGFNVGAATEATEAGLIWVNTLVCPAAAMVGWLLLERIRDKHSTSLGAASGIVAGLVAITPACAYITPVASIGLGLVTGVLSALAVGLKYKFGYDDSLDVVGVHLVSGLVGTLALGFIAVDTGLFYGGGLDQFWSQLVAALVSIVWCALATFVIGIVLHKTIGFRISASQEVSGVDLGSHAETAYEFGGLGTGSRFVPHPATSGHISKPSVTTEEK